MLTLLLPRARRWSFRVLLLSAAVLFGWAVAANAQVPAVPAVPAAPAVPGAAGVAVPAAPAAPSNLWSFLCPTEDQKAACRAKLCKLPITQLFGNMLAPVSLFSGGLITSCCPTGPSAADLAAPPDSAEGAAARIQQSEAEAKKRRLTIRYLGTVDCRYWPEAEAALATALRADPNECVRYEAALALTNGCCCTRPIMEALVLCASGTDKDHHPAETSPRVLQQARLALDHCLCRYTQVVTPPDSNQRPEKPEQPRPATNLPDARTLPALSVPPSAAVPVAANTLLPLPGQRSLLDVARRAAPSPEPPLAETTAATQPAAPGKQRDLMSVLWRSVSGGQ